MLMKLLFCDGRDYTRSLKHRRLAAVGLLWVGLVGIGGYFLLVPGSGLPDFAQGFYLGAASGITFGAVLLLIRSQYLLTHPEAQKKARIKETDERERQIVETAFRLAGVVTFFTAAAALFVALPLSIRAFQALMGVILLYALTFFLAALWLPRRM